MKFFVNPNDMIIMMYMGNLIDHNNNIKYEDMQNISFNLHGNIMQKHNECYHLYYELDELKKYIFQ